MTQEIQTGTLEELNVKPGDVVMGTYVGTERTYTDVVKEIKNGKVFYQEDGFDSLNGGSHFRIVSRATTPITIEAGKYYKTRDGRKVGPMEGVCFKWVEGAAGVTDPEWDNDGSYRYGYTTRCDDLIAEWTDTPTDTTPTWGEMTDAEKGAMLLARFEGKELEYYGNGMNVWYKDHGFCFMRNFAYRIKPEPLVETVTAYAQPELGEGFEVNSHCEHWPFRITFTTTNGEPDLDSIKMERIND